MNGLGLMCGAEGSYTDAFYTGDGGIGTSSFTGVIASLAGAPMAGLPLRLIIPGTPCDWPMSDMGCAPPPPPVPPPPPAPPSPPPMPCTITAVINRTVSGPISMPDPCSIFIYFMRSSYAAGVNVSSWQGQEDARFAQYCRCASLQGGGYGYAGREVHFNLVLSPPPC